MKCAVLGDPIAHSLSPVIHRAGYLALGLDGLALRRGAGRQRPPVRLGRGVGPVGVAGAVADDAAQA